jgi:hypothetical protein
VYFKLQNSESIVMQIFRSLIAATIASCLLASVVAAQDMPSSPPAEPPAPAQMEPVILTPDMIERFIAAATELKTLGLEAAADGQLDPNDPAQMANLMQAGSQAMQIMSKNGFDMMNFQQVAYSVTMAAGAAQIDVNQAEVDMLRQQLEAMKSQMPPEQYEQARKGLTGMDSIYSEQPPENIALVKNYMDELIALGTAVPE